jgi:fucose permease
MPMTDRLDHDSRRLFVLCLIGFVIFGAVFTIVGAALPEIIRKFHWTYALTGVVLAGNTIGYFVSSFICGLLVQRIRPKTILLAGLCIGAVGMALFGRTQSAWLNLVFNLAIGLCQGGLEVVINLEVVHMERHGQSRFMNLLHAAFCVGAVVGPGATGYLIGQGGANPFVVFSIAAVLSLLVAGLFSLARFPALPAEASVRGGARALLRTPFLLLLTFFLLVYVGAEIGVSTWVSEYVVQVLGVTAATGAFAVAVFWMGLLVGRLAISFLYKGSRQQILILGLSTLSACSLGLMLLARNPYLVALWIFFTGLGFSGIYPLVMVMVGRRFKSSVAIGTAGTGGGIGSFTFPFLMAILAQEVGIRGGFIFYLGVSALLAALAGLIVWITRREPMND